MVGLICFGVIVISAEGASSYFNRDHGLAAICEREWGLTGCTPGRGIVGPQHPGELLRPISFGLLQFCLESMLDYLVDGLSLAVGLRVTYG